MDAGVTGDWTDDIEMVNLEEVEGMAEKMLIDYYEEDDDNNYGDCERIVMEISAMKYDE